MLGPSSYHVRSMPGGRLSLLSLSVALPYLALRSRDRGVTVVSLSTRRSLTDELPPCWLAALVPVFANVGALVDGVAGVDVCSSRNMEKCEDH